VQTYTRAPTAVERDSLAAHIANGTAVRWRGEVPAMAMEIDQDPVTLGVRVAAVAPPGSRVVVRDELGVLDSATGSAAFSLDGVLGSLSLSAGTEALGAVVPSPRRRAVAVFGPAGWEARYLIEALEGADVPVVTRLRVGPQTHVAQGSVLPLDTGRHAVAAVLGPIEATASAQIRRFVRDGGGLVLGNGEWGLADLAPGRLGRAVRPPAALALPERREDLIARPIAVRPGAEALTVGRSDGRTVVVRGAARVVGSGRVVQLGDQDTWRLAMASDAARAEHVRMWLSAIATASSRNVARPRVMDEVAPRAALVAALGPPSDGTAGGTGIPWEELIVIATLVVLLAEWAVRRHAGHP
jgi:hypothetical protein